MRRFATFTLLLVLTKSAAGGWVVESSEVSVMTDANIAHTGSNFLALASGHLAQTFPTVPGASYEFRYYARSPGIISWWPAEGNANDLLRLNNASLASGADYAAGEVGKAFSFNGTSAYVSCRASTSLNVGADDGFTIECWINPVDVSTDIPLVEWNDGTDIGTHFWVSTGAPYLTRPGSLYGNLIDTKGVYHYFSSAGGIVKDNTFQHVALTYDKSSGVGAMYYNGAVVASQNLGIFTPQTSYNLFIGHRPSAFYQYFTGEIDETSIYNRALSAAEVSAIYKAGSSGKYSTNSLYPNFQLDVDGISTNTLIITNFDATNWIAYTNSFVATSNQTTIELAGNPLGVLLDDIALVQLAYTNFNNYYLPEEPLTPIIGQNPQGCWTLSIWDTRQDSPLPTNGTLLGWTLQLTTSSTNVNLIVLTNGVPYHETANAGITYFGVDVPLTANYATNTLLKAQGPMTLLFNQDALPTGGLPGDFTLFTLNGPQTDSATLTTEGVPPQLIPGQRYFLGVRNDGTAPEAFGLEVDFDVSTNTSGIFPLKNGIPLTKSVGANGPEFYSFFVPTNAVMASFQLLSPTNGQADLFARASLPVPGPLSFDYESANAGANDQFIVITTNSMPVPLQKAPVNDVLPISPTTWYLSVYNFAGTGNVGYTILATYITNGAMNIINLNNQSNYTAYQTNAPGFPTNLLYSFTVTNTNVAALQFTVTNISDNGDLQLLVGDGVFPTPEDFYIGSFNPGAANQTVTIVTNTVMTSLSNIWYAAVPNVSTNHAVVSYSITAAVSTNVMIAIPLFIGASIASPTNGFTMYWSAIPGTTYQIQVSTNLNSWAAVTNITPQTTTGSYTDAVPVISQTSRFFRIMTP